MAGPVLLYGLQGNRKKKFKRGFRTKSEAVVWARDFLQQQESNLDEMGADDEYGQYDGGRNSYSKFYETYIKLYKR